MGSVKTKTTFRMLRAIPVAPPAGTTEETMGRTGSASYVNAFKRVAVPPAPSSTPTSTTDPAVGESVAAGGTVQRMLVASTTFTVRAATPPKVTVVPEVNCVPWTMTCVPPAPGPAAGVTEVMESVEEESVKAEAFEPAWRSGFVTVTSRAPRVALLSRSKSTVSEEAELKVVWTLVIPFVPEGAVMEAVQPLTKCVPVTSMDRASVPETGTATEAGLTEETVGAGDGGGPPSGSVVKSSGTFLEGFSVAA
jgi:hypothetical protein